MTRTERAVSPRALMKDRSEARNGLDPHLRKGGAGAHNWGALGDEARYELEALHDEEDDLDRAARDGDVGSSPLYISSPSAPEEDRLAALRIRQHALKGDVDLADIARSSAAVSSSPPRENGVFPTTTTDSAGRAA
ncbi:hypothetical protein K488DRAFT_81280 [Vararia minispora EC-137]|uniref:Uncharacterized protein n=1 Tax=Vararia minispora EC-137 TaxID=1314806 RepID=A0ACB8Q5L0_9AGAM|nr:hypothetical protein K488DRAFT_81280 [Vararia minispora EC-137]